MRIDAGRSICLALMLAVMHAGVATAEPQIVWQVENPFRFFLDPADTAGASRDLAQPVGEPSAAIPCSRRSGRSASAIQTDGAPSCSPRPAGTAHATATPAASAPTIINPKSHTILARLEGLEDAQTVDCSWLTSPQGQARGPRSKAVTLPCDTPVQLEVPYPSGAWISVEIGGSQVAETAARVTDLFIVGMGDSFASGEGNPDVPVRFSPERTTDYGVGSNERRSRAIRPASATGRTIGDKKFIEENARWQDQACHRSLYSHQLRAALQLAVEDPHRAVTFVGVRLLGRGDDVRPVPANTRATSGCPIRRTCRRSRPSPRRSAAARRRATTICPRPITSTTRSPSSRAAWCSGSATRSRARKIDLLLLSVGGNDIGFARLVANAVLADKSILRQLGGWFGQVHGFAEASRQLDALDDRLKSVNRALHNLLHVPWPESDRIILTGYPPMALLDDGKTVCPDGQAGMTVLPEFVSERGQGARGQRGGRAAQRHHAGERAPASVVVRRRAPRRLPRPRPVRRLQRRALDHGGRAARAAQGQRRLGALQPIANGEPTRPRQRCSARPTMPS